MNAIRDHVPWLAPLLVFGVVVFVHEFGHFLAAKLVGVYAPRFSIGFGPALWHHRFGETEYRLSVLPFGGYVRMASRDDDATAMLEGGPEESADGTRADWDPNAMLPFGPKPIPEDRWFESKPLAARLVIMLAGVAMNFLLAFVVLTGLIAYYGPPSAAPTHAVVDSVNPNTPAERAGLVAGDSIVSINGAPIQTADDVVAHVTPAVGVPLAIDVFRQGARQTLTATPIAFSDTDQTTHAVKTIGRLGFGFRRTRHPVSLLAAAPQGARFTAEVSKEIVEQLGLLLTGRVSLKTLSGPVRIAQVSVEEARRGFESLLLLLAAISVNVAIFNLLPIPILDGGQVVVNVAESIKGSPFSLRTREMVVRTGLLAIALLVMLVMYNDRCVLLHVFAPGLCS